LHVRVTPIEIMPFQVIVLVLKHLLVVPEFCGLVKLRHDIGPPDTGWAVGLMVPVTYVFLFSDYVKKQGACWVII